MTKPMVNEKIAKPGRIVITSEEVSSTANAEMVIFDPIVRNLNSSGLCFFILYRFIAPGKYTPIYKSEIKKPVSGAFNWNQVQVGATDLCKDDVEQEIKIEFFQS